MANANYRKLSDGSWINQGCPGAPAMFRVNHYDDGNNYSAFTWNGIDWIQLPGNGNIDPTIVQAALDTYVGKLNAGTA